jgi:uncharacterized membrane protein
VPRIESTLHVDAPVERVYAVARDVESFPEIMEDLQSITVLERSEDGNRTVTQWVGTVAQFRLTLKWQQEDVWDPARHRDDFKALKGDVDELSGYWQFTEDAGGTRFDSLVDYEVNVPLVGPLVKNIIHKIMVKNLEAQMQAIKLRAETL